MTGDLPTNQIFEIVIYEQRVTVHITYMENFRNSSAAIWANLIIFFNKY